MKPITAADLIRVLLELDQQVICPRPSAWGLSAELVGRLALIADLNPAVSEPGPLLGNYQSIDLSPVRRPAPRGELRHPTVDRLTVADVLSVEELVAQRDQLVAAASTALAEWRDIYHGPGDHENCPVCRAMEGLGEAVGAARGGHPAGHGEGGESDAER